jgi:hypothetical protein
MSLWSEIGNGLVLIVASEGFLGWVEVSFSKSMHYMSYLASVSGERPDEYVQELRCSKSAPGWPCCDDGSALHALHRSHETAIRQSPNSNQPPTEKGSMYKPYNLNWNVPPIGYRNNVLAFYSRLKKTDAEEVPRSLIWSVVNRWSTEVHRTVAQVRSSRVAGIFVPLPKNLQPRSFVLPWMCHIT